MNLSIKSIIYQAIFEDKWLRISYVNKDGDCTEFFIGINDIDINKGRIYCEIFNPYKDINCLINSFKSDLFIHFIGIKKAEILEQTYYPVPDKLKERINKDHNMSTYLEVDKLDNNILLYLSECYKLDNDPFLKEYILVDGVDKHTLEENFFYELDKKQFEGILKKLYKDKNQFEIENINRFSTLAINIFSIDIGDKQYVVAYRKLGLNFKNKELHIEPEIHINKSFLIEENKKVTLSTYLDIDPDYFQDTFKDNMDEYIHNIASNFDNGEKINTRPTIFLLSRNATKGVEQAFEAIYELDIEKKLSQPLKSFFGRNKINNGSKKEVNIVVFNRNKINIDQMRVVYNSMVNHVTYVKGPPGTGKTETIFNVILSAYANDKTVLVCSNNNHPVSDIYKKMSESLFFSNNRTHKKENIIFPMIRLGNMNEMLESIEYLRKLLEFVKEHEKSVVKEQATESSKNRSLSGFKELKELLTKYESQLDLIERIEILKKIRQLTTIDKINIKLDEQLWSYQDKLDNTSTIKDEDVLKYAISASEDKHFQNYLYYSSLLKLKKLNDPSFKQLREILYTADPLECVLNFNKWLKNDANLKKFLNVFPIVICTNLSCDKLGSPGKSHFDLVIMDEAGQCNIASSLIPISRGSDLLLVGDTNQLQPVTVLESQVNDNLKHKYNISDQYDYIHNSILSTMLRKDNNSKNILLSYHYRCGRKIANFVNQRFYEEKLKLLNNKSGELIYYNVKNFPNPDLRNAYLQEAKEIVKIIIKNKYKDVGIITPFVNQAKLINKLLLENGIEDVTAGTVHTLQGSEKSVIILSSALSLATARKTMDWIKDNHELINVAVTRAKESFIFIGDKKAIDTLSGNDLNDIKVLSDYVYKNGEIIVPKSDAIIKYDFSNDSKNEKDFFDTVKPYFNRRGSKFKTARNVPVKDAIKKINDIDYKMIGKKEFDFIVQAKAGVFGNQYHTIVAFEIDGGEHIGSSRTIQLDRIKEEICKKYGIKLIRIPNSAVKDYESIISLFEFVVKDLKDLDEAYNQITIFDETYD